MNSGLPYLIDAIFGKKDLASVPLEELYEVIHEFPSFNAGHLLLSKKLKLQNGEDYEKEIRRTALYFNNTFWLQALLDEGGNDVLSQRGPSEENISPGNHLQESGQEYVSEEIFPVSSSFEEENAIEQVLPVADLLFEFRADEQIPTPGEAVDEKDFSEKDFSITGLVHENSVDTPVHIPDESEKEEKFSGPVSSFDELLSKYKIDPLEEPIEKEEEPAFTTAAEFPEKPEEPLYEEPARQEIEMRPAPFTEIITEPGFEIPSEPLFVQEEIIPESAHELKDEEEYSEEEKYETREEVLNEYGIFEDVVVKKSDLDLEAFDPPAEMIPAESESPSSEREIIPAENESIVENRNPEQERIKPEDQDYEAFDGPGDADDTEISSSSTGGVNELNGMPEEMGDRFAGQQKSLAAFDPKNAESIVFAPYHMIDYFASQGIKLILEDNPPDNFGRQLKSFTDWLKVMKKLPVQPASEKTDERESDRIRHFASHSLEERDILTESMAEVLAKQGMYENAIALYQKLSLIYPPKSAYFASRIEQLKASLQ